VKNGYGFDLCGVFRPVHYEIYSVVCLFYHLFYIYWHLVDWHAKINTILWDFFIISIHGM